MMKKVLIRAPNTIEDIIQTYPLVHLISNELEKSSGSDLRLFRGRLTALGQSLVIVQVPLNELFHSLTNKGGRLVP